MYLLNSHTLAITLLGVIPLCSFSKTLPVAVPGKTLSFWIIKKDQNQGLESVMKCCLWTTILIVNLNMIFTFPRSDVQFWKNMEWKMKKTQ